MKKISTLLLSAAAMAFAANAADLTPENVELANPSFEEHAEDCDVSKNHTCLFPGWEYTGSVWTNADTGGAGVISSCQVRTASWTNGNWGVRSGADVDIPEDEANYMYQKVLAQKPGTYVLTFDGQVARDASRSAINTIEGAHGFAFICDNYGDVDEYTDSEGVSYVYGDNQSLGNNYFQLWRWYVVHTTGADVALDEETDLTIGFGFPAGPAISKARIACDNFTLRYFDTEDTDAVNAFVNAEIEAIKAGEFSNPVAPEEGADPAPVANAIANGSFNTVLCGFSTNTGYVDENSGISNVADTTTQDNKYYNLQGIEIAKPTTAGLYIHNGKKFIVK